MALIDYTYFVGEIQIPNLATPELQSRINWFINQYEIKMLREWMGEDMYRDFMDALGLNGSGFDNVTDGQANEGMDPWWAQLLNGVEYVGLDERKHKWKGIVCLQDDYNTSKTAPSAYFVYYWYMRDAVTQTTGNGEIFKQAENGIIISPRQKVVTAWQKVVDWAHDFIWYMDTYYLQTEYVDWWLANRYRMLEKYRYINSYSI